MAKTESCFSCVYSHWDRNQAVWSFSAGVPVRPTCGNQPDFPGRMRECLLGQICVNFRARPPTPEGETVKTIPLGHGYYAYVDAADYEWLSQWTWTLRGGYAVRMEKRKPIYMHRQIMQPPKGKVVDHWNLNKLDNTRANLRNCTHQENAGNRSKKRGTFSRFRGVGLNKDYGKYFAQVYYKGKRHFLGYFANEIEAAQAHDRKAVELFGEFAQVNFPEEWSARRRAAVYARFQASRKRETKKRRKVRKDEGKKVGRKEGKAGKRSRPRRTGSKPRRS